MLDSLCTFAGSVLDTSLGVVIDRLRGLCDNADILPETFHDHEVVFVLKDFNGKLLFGVCLQIFYLFQISIHKAVTTGKWN